MFVQNQFAQPPSFDKVECCCALLYFASNKVGIMYGFHAKLYASVMLDRWAVALLECSDGMPLDMRSPMVCGRLYAFLESC